MFSMFEAHDIDIVCDCMWLLMIIPVEYEPGPVRPQIWQFHVDVSKDSGTRKFLFLSLMVDMHILYVPMPFCALCMSL